MKKRNIKIITLILSCLLLVGAAVGITVSASETAPTVRTAKINVAYESAIQIVYAVEASDGYTVKMVFSYDDAITAPAVGSAIDETQYAYVKTATDDILTIDGTNYNLVFSNGFSPKDMTKTLYSISVLVDESGNVVAVGNTAAYSIYDYAYGRLSGSYTADQFALYTALLNFGASVQQVLLDSGEYSQDEIDKYGWADAYYTVSVTNSTMKNGTTVTDAKDKIVLRAGEVENGTYTVIPDETAFSGRVPAYYTDAQGNKSYDNVIAFDGIKASVTVNYERPVAATPEYVSTTDSLTLSNAVDGKQYMETLSDDNGSYISFIKNAKGISGGAMNLPQPTLTGNYADSGDVFVYEADVWFPEAPTSTGSFASFNTYAYSGTSELARYRLDICYNASTETVYFENNQSVMNHEFHATEQSDGTYKYASVALNGTSHVWDYEYDMDKAGGNTDIHWSDLESIRVELHNDGAQIPYRIYYYKTDGTAKTDDDGNPVYEEYLTPVPTAKIYINGEYYGSTNMLQFKGLSTTTLKPTYYDYYEKNALNLGNCGFSYNIATIATINVRNWYSLAYDKRDDGTLKTTYIADADLMGNTYEDITAAKDAFTFQAPSNTVFDVDKSDGASAGYATLVYEGDNQVLEFGKGMNGAASPNTNGVTGYMAPTNAGKYSAGFVTYVADFDFKWMGGKGVTSATTDSECDSQTSSDPWLIAFDFGNGTNGWTRRMEGSVNSDGGLDFKLLSDSKLFTVDKDQWYNIRIELTPVAGGNSTDGFTSVYNIYLDGVKVCNKTINTYSKKDNSTFTKFIIDYRMYADHAQARFDNFYVGNEPLGKGNGVYYSANGGTNYSEYSTAASYTDLLINHNANSLSMDTEASGKGLLSIKELEGDDVLSLYKPEGAGVESIFRFKFDKTSDGTLYVFETDFMMPSYDAETFATDVSSSHWVRWRFYNSSGAVLGSQILWNQKSAGLTGNSTFTPCGIPYDQWVNVRFEIDASAGLSSSVLTCYIDGLVGTTWEMDLTDLDSISFNPRGRVTGGDLYDQVGWYFDNTFCGTVK